MKRYLAGLWGNRATLVLLVAAVVAGGWVAVTSLPESVFPNVAFPRVTVLVSAGELPVRYMLLEVTRPLEELAKGVAGVRTVRSQTGIGLSKLHIYFDSKVNPRIAYLMVQARLAAVALPPGAKLSVRLMTPHIKPFAQYALVSNRVDSSAMMPFYAFHVRPSLLSLSGVYQVNAVGRGWPEVRIRLDRRKLAAYHLGAAEVIAALKAYQGPFYAGLIATYHQQFLLVMSPRPADARALERLNLPLGPVQAGGGRQLIPLTDLGSVKIGPPPRVLGAAVAGYRHALLIDVSAQAGANVKTVAAGVRERIGTLSRHLPPGVRLVPIYDFSHLIGASLTDVWIALILGAAFAWLVVLLFIGRMDAALGTLVVVPIALAGTFIVLKALGFGLNIMTLGGITAAIGALVDHAIVVMEQGLHGLVGEDDPARRRGRILTAAGEIMPLMSMATLTSSVVFLPLVFLSGTLGLLFRHMAIAIVVALVVSQLVALSVTPVIAAALAGRIRSRRRRRWVVFRRLRIGYAWSLRMGLHRPWLGIPVVLALVAIGLLSGFGLKTAFLPSWDQGAIAIPFRTPVGTPVSETLVVARRLAALAQRNPSVERVSAVVGRSLENPRATSNKGDLVVILRRQRGRTTTQVMVELRRAIHAAEPNLIELKLHQIMTNRLGNLSGSHAPLEVLLFGQHPSELRRYGAELTGLIRRDGGFVGTTFKSPSAGPEVAIEPRSGRLYGLTPREIADQVRAETRGRKAGFLLRGEQILPIRVNVGLETGGPQTVLDFPVRLANGRLTPLGHVARTRLIGTVPFVTHDNLVPYAYIQTTPKIGKGLAHGAARLRQLIAEAHLPANVNAVVGGYYRQQARGFRQMTAILGGVLLILLVLLGFQFGSQRAAIAALTSVALASSGAFLALRLAGIALDSTAFLGLLLVLAIAVNNVILIFSLARKRLGAVPTVGAVERAARARLRPILMTMLADVLGFLPLAIGVGRGTELLKPLAVAVMGGLALALVSSVWLGPVLYAGLRCFGVPKHRSD